MKSAKECPRCGSSNIEKGHQEVFPSTFIKSSRYSLIKALANSKEFEIYACMDCGYSEWYIQNKYLDGKGKKAKMNPKIQH
jgi:predicted nucleic-acid-binding Zn-ribbon protein